MGPPTIVRPPGFFMCGDIFQTFRSRVVVAVPRTKPSAAEVTSRTSACVESVEPHSPAVVCERMTSCWRSEGVC